MQFDALEPRTLFSVYQIAGASSVNLGSAYALSLTSDSTSIQSWSINWGDGTTQTPDVQTVAGGSTSVSHTYANGPTTETVSAIATDTDGTHTVTPTTVAVSSSVPAYTNGFNSGDLHLAGNASLSGNSVLLTSQGAQQEASVAYFSNTLNAQSFLTQFAFQVSGSADGFTFIIQNNSSGDNAVGSNGGGLGSYNLANSVAVKFDIFDNAGEGSNSTGLYLNGALPEATDSVPFGGGVQINDGTTYLAILYYNGTSLTLTVTNASDASKTFTTSWDVNIPSVIGSNNAYFGFTGATGGQTSTQQINSWTYMPAAVPTTQGTILRQVWTNVGGTFVTDLTSEPAYPNTPNQTDYPTSFEAPTNWADSYGTRMRGYVTAPVTGSYTFWIASDDSSELYLSTDDNPANKQMIADVPDGDWTNSEQWNKYPDQQSVTINLVAGQRYYIEALQKEGAGGDNLAVAWSGPAFDQQVIRGEYLDPYVATTAPAAPSGLAAVVSSDGADLTWQDNSDGETGFIIQRSTDGTNFTTIATADPNTTSYTDSAITSPDNYWYRVVATGAVGDSAYSNVAAAFYPIAISRTGWTAYGNVTPSNAIDGDPSTRFTTGAYQTSGQFFEVDMGQQQTFGRIVMDATDSTDDYPRGYAVYVSSDGVNWGNPVAIGAGSQTVTTVDFATQTARYLKIVQTESSSDNYWSIGEFNVYGPITPLPSISGSSIATEGTPYTLNLSSTGFVQNIISSWSINWGDGTEDSPDIQIVAGNPSTVTHNYTIGGFYPISAAVTDQYGTYSANTTGTTAVAAIVNYGLAGSPTVNEGSPYTLQLVSNSPTIQSWTINWGDGTAQQPDIQQVSGNLSNVQHTYADGPNSFSITATATDLTGVHTANLITVDQTFGTGGIVTSTLGDYEAKTVSALQADGKIVAASVINGMSYILKRFNADGTLDTTFGTNGEVITDTGQGLQATGIVIQSDGKIIVVGSMGQGNGVVIARYTAAGVLDNTYGNAGMVVEEFTQTFDSEFDVQTPTVEPVLTSDGELVIATAADDNSIGIIKFNTNGSIDTAWGSSGTAWIQVAPDLSVTGLTVGADGSLYVAGVVEQQAAYVVKLNAEGSVDDTFNGGEPIVQFVPDSGQAATAAVAVEPNGTVLFAVTGEGGLPSLVYRISADGSSSTPIAMVPPPDFVVENLTARLLLQPDGKIVFAQTSQFDGYWTAARFNADGTIDPTFGGTGMFFTDVDTAGSLSLMIDSNGNLLLAGNSEANGGYVIGKYAHNSSLPVKVLNVAPTLTISGDSSVNEGAPYTLHLASSDPGTDTISSWTINWGDGTTQTISGNPASVTHAYADGPSIFNISATATDEDGTYSSNVLAFDPTFGTAGVVNTTSLASIAAQADGKVLAAVSVASNSSFLYDAVTLSRYNSNGTLNTGFGAGGSVYTAIPTNGANEDDVTVSKVLTQPDGKILVVGYIYYESWTPSSSQSGATFVIRYNSNGTLDTGFGTSGLAVINYPSLGEGASATLQSDGKIVLASDELNLSNFDRQIAVTRLNADGSLDQTFGSGGTENYSSSSSLSPSGIAVQLDGKIVVTGVAAGVFIARFNTDGSSDTSFGSNGLLSLTTLSQLSDPQIQVDANGNYVLSGFVVGQNSPSVLMSTRYTSAGILDTTYGTNGTQQISYSGLLQVPSSIASLPGGQTLISVFTSNGASIVRYGFLSVQNVPPTLTISGLPSANSGTSYTLHLASSDPGADTISSWTINWGDGTTQDPDTQVVTGNPSSVTHTYSSNGSYTISASAADEDGTYAAASALNVQVLSTSGSTHLQVTSTTLSVLRNVAATNIVLAQIADVYDDGDPSAYETTVNWGDGAPIDTTATVQWNDDGGFEVVGTHTYTSGGNFAPTITVTHIADNNSAIVQGTVNVLGMQATTGSTPDQIQLTYSSVPGETLELEEAGPGDLNYHVVTGFVPDYSSGPHTATISGLQGNSHYDFRLRSVLNGSVQYFTAFANTTSANGGSTLPVDVGTSVTNSSGQTGINFTWSPSNGTQFTVTVRAYSSAQPLSIFNAATCTQSFTIPASDYTSNNVYSFLASLPADADQIEVQITDGSNVSPWAGVSRPVAALPTAPTLSLSTTANPNGSVSFTLGSSAAGELYGITTSNQIVDLGIIASGSALTLAASSLSSTLQEVFASDGTHYSDFTALPGATPSTPAAPTNLTVTPSQNATGSHTVTLIWDDNADNESGYVIERLDLSQANASWETTGMVASDQTRFIDTPPSAHDVYQYRVIATNAGSMSAPSNTAVVWFAPQVSAIGVNPEAPTVGSTVTLSATALPEINTQDSLTFSWTLTNTSVSGTVITQVTSSPTLSFTPPSAGNWIASLTVTDSILGLSSVVTTPAFTVSAGNPAQVLGPSMVTEGQSATFSTTGLVSGTITWTVVNGTTVVASGAGDQFSFTPTTSGSYSVSATGVNSSNVSVTTLSTLTASYVAPTVTISGPALGFVGKALTFGSEVDQSTGANDPIAYQWQLLNSDGSVYQYGTGVTSNPSTLSTLVVPGSLASGSYVAQLTISDSHNGTTTTIAKTFNFSVLQDPSSTNVDWGTVPTASSSSVDTEVADAVTQQSDGKYIVAGYDFSDSGYEAFIARFNSDLTLDTTFGANHTGVVAVQLDPNYPSNWSDIFSVSINPLNNDVIVVGEAGMNTETSTPMLSIEEYLTSDTVTSNGTILEAGIPDPNFNGGQAKTLESTTTVSAGMAVSVLSDGSILVGGTVGTFMTSEGDATYENEVGYSPGSWVLVSDFLLVKLTSTGQLDTTFNGTGIAEQPELTQFDAYTPFTQVTGSPDLSSTYNFPGADFSTEIRSLTILANGQILAAGYATRLALNPDGSLAGSGNDVGIALVEYNSDGTLDTSFGNNGSTFTSSGAFDSAPDGIAYLGAIRVTSNGSIIVAGAAATEADRENGLNIFLAGYTSAGNLDSSFGTDGIIHTSYFLQLPDGNSYDVDAGFDHHLGFTSADLAFAFQDNGDLVVSGMIGEFQEAEPTPYAAEWTILRFDSDGNLDTSFATGGTLDVGATWPIAANSTDLNAWYIADQRPTSILLTSTGVLALGDIWPITGSSDADSSVSMIPVLVRYSDGVDPTVANVQVSASSDGKVTISWSNAGYSEDGYEIEQSTTLAGLDSPGAVIGDVGSTQFNFIDKSASSNTSYYYRVVPLYTDATGIRQSGIASNAVTVQTYPSNSNNVLQETIQVPLNSSVVTSNDVLTLGQTYIIVASGFLYINGEPVADAQYWYSASNPTTFGSTLNNASYGLALSTDIENPSVPYWGSYNPDNHTYSYVIVGQGQPLSLSLIAPGSLIGSLDEGDEPLRVQIFSTASGGTTSTPAVPIMRIISPEPETTGAPAVISTNTAITIVSVNSDGTSTPWALWLVDSAGDRTLLANGSQAVGALPDVGANVATINPSLYQNGEYTLELTSSLSDPQDTIVDSREIAIATVVKSGNFTLPVTDDTLSTPIGPVTISRVYNSNSQDTSSYFGNGWTLSTLDAQLITTAQPASSIEQSPLAFRAGDLIYLTVPDDGAHVFEFVPVALSNISTYGGSSTSILYSPEFVAIDGSGATLTLPYQQKTQIMLAYNPADNDYVAVGDYSYFDQSGNYVYDQAYFNSLPFNPSAPEFGNEYTLTTKDGTSYGINATTGHILSVTDPNGNTITYTPTSDGTITATLQNGDALFTVYTDSLGHVISISTGGDALSNLSQGSGGISSDLMLPESYLLMYTYDANGNLASVQYQSGDKTFYSYQDPNFPDYLTGVTNSQGQTVLQVQYNSLGQLSSLTNINGKTVPISTVTLGANQVLETSADAMGDVTQEIIDERYGTILRKIQTTTDSSGNTAYIVTVNEFSYVTDDTAQMSSLQQSGVQMFQTLETFSSFEIDGPDAAGLRYFQQPDPNSWTKLITFDTSDSIDDAGRGQPISLAVQTTSTGAIQKTLLAGYVFTNAALMLAKPEETTQEIEIPLTSGGYTVYTQSITYTGYDNLGRETYSVVSIGTDPSNGNVIATGTENDYNGSIGYGNSVLSGTQNVTAEIQSNGSISLSTTANNVTQDIYYTLSESTIAGYQVGTPGSQFGAVKYTVDAAGQETFYAYDAEGHPVLEYVYKQWTDSNGNPVHGWVGTTTTYDALGNVVDVYSNVYVDPNHTQNLDGNGYHILQTIASGAAGVDVNTAIYGQPTSSIHTTHNDYNSLGQKIDSIDQYGGTTTYTYDSQGHVIRTVDPDGTETRTVYDALGRAIWTSQTFAPINGDPSSAANTTVLTHTIYNQLGQVVDTDQVQGGTIEITTTQDGTSLTWTSIEVGGAVFSSTKTYYDPAGNAIETISPSGLRTGTIYNPDGTVAYTGVLNASAPDGGHVATTNGVTTAEYTVSDFVSYTYTLYNQYNATLNLFYTRVIDQNGNTTDTYTDNLGRTVRTVYDDGSFTETLYSVGNQLITKDQEGDTISNPTHGWTGIPSGGYEEVTIGQRKSGDPLVLTYYLYNVDNELIDVWQPAVIDGNPNSSTHGQSVEPRTAYTYDSAGNNLTQTDANGNTTTFKYDQNGNMVREILPGGQTETWTYNSLNEVTSHVDFDGQTTVYTYLNTANGQGKPLTEYFFNTGVSAFDSNSNLLTINAAEATTIHYNTLGQQVEVDDYTSGVLSRQTFYTYDPLTQQLASVTSPEGTIVYTYHSATGLLASTTTAYTSTSYGYDEQGRLTTVTVTKLDGQTLTTPLVTTYGYDAAGNKTSETLPDGEVTTYTYDHLNRLTDVVETQGGTTLFSEHYTLNDDGTRASSTESQLQADGTTETITTVWTYDQEQRLTSETSTSSISADSYSDTYTYDQVGNRMTDTHTGPGGGANETTTYLYNSDDELTSQVSSLSGTTTFAYDANGSLTSETNGSSVTTYTYDVRNKLATVSVNGVLIAIYTYDDQGNRVSETTAAGTTYYLTDTNNPTFYAQPLEAKTSLTGAPVMTYLIGDRVYGQVTSNGTASYMLIDGHGSTRALTNSSGTVTNTFNYDAFGTAINFDPSTAPTIFLFGGDAVYDAASGLYLNGDGIRARLMFFFIQRDTYQGNTQDPLTLHKYLYASANVVNNNDPTGYFALIDTGLAAGEGLSLDVAAINSGNAVLEDVGEVILESTVESAEENGAITELSGDSTWADGGHHPVPKYLGGSDDQMLWDLSGEDHAEIHRYIDDALADEFAGEGAPAGRSSVAWAKFLAQDPQNFQRVLYALSNAYEDFFGLID